MDVQLPGMDGVEALARLRADAETAEPARRRRDRVRDEGRPRPLPRRGLRRLHREADQRARLPRAGRRAAGRSRRSARMSWTHPGRRRPAAEHPPARGGARARAATRSSPRAPAREALEQLAARRHRPRAARHRDARDGRLRGLPAHARGRGDALPAGRDDHRERRAGEARVDRGRRGRLRRQAVRPARAARARALAAADQGVPRHDRGAVRRARRLQPRARGARPGAGRRARAARPAAPLPVAAARRAGGVLRRRTRSSRATAARSRWCSATCGASPRSRRRWSRRT